MDRKAPAEDIATNPPRPARVALNVLALCFALSVLGRGLGESFTVFLKPISESFGWDRAQVVSVYSLTWLARGPTAPPVGRLFHLSCPRCLYALGLLLPCRLFSSGSQSFVKKADTHVGENGWTLVRAMRHHAFWALFSTFFFTAVAMYAIAAQIVAYLIDAGFPPLQAATAWGFSGIVLVFGMLGVSTLDGIIGRRPSVLFSYGVSIAGIIMLWLLQYYPNFLLLTGFIVCFASMLGSRGPLITATALNIFP